MQDKTHADIWWVELSAARTKDLLMLTEKAVNVLKKHDITPLNDVGDLYHPHLTP